MLRSVIYYAAVIVLALAGMGCVAYGQDNPKDDTPYQTFTLPLCPPGKICSVDCTQVHPCVIETKAPPTDPLLHRLEPFAWPIACVLIALIIDLGCALIAFIQRPTVSQEASK